MYNIWKMLRIASVSCTIPLLTDLTSPTTEAFQSCCSVWSSGVRPRTRVPRNSHEHLAKLVHKEHSLENAGLPVLFADEQP